MKDVKHVLENCIRYIKKCTKCVKKNPDIQKNVQNVFFSDVNKNVESVLTHVEKK